jgi:gliding motility-associated-like protein
LVVKDANGCEYNAPSITLNNSNGPSAVSVTTIDPNCGQSNGSVLIGNVTGGTAPYEYNFNNIGFSSLTDYLNLSEGNYSIAVKDVNGCNYQGVITLNTAIGNPTVFIPNVFTPNEDNNAVNEEWKITTSCVSNVSCQIFNRWGNLIYEFDDLNGSWSGENLTGQKVSDGIYFYKLVLSYPDDSEDEKQGFITLIR